MTTRNRLSTTVKSSVFERLAINIFVVKGPTLCRTSKWQGGLVGRGLGTGTKRKKKAEFFKSVDLSM